MDETDAVQVEKMVDQDTNYQANNALDIDTNDPRRTLEVFAGRRVGQTLKGNKLPNGWPNITSEDDYGPKKYGPFQQEGKRPIPARDFSIHLKSGEKVLQYTAVEHTNDSSNPQFEELEKQFDETKPQVVLYEGPVSNFPITDINQAYAFGEKSFMNYLVQQYNANLGEGEKSIVLESTDMPNDALIKSFQDRGNTNEEIGVYDIVRQINNVAEAIRRNSSMTDEQKTRNIALIDEQIKNDFLEFVREKQFSSLLPMLHRQDGRQWNNSIIAEEVKRVTGHDLNANLHQTEIDKLRQMFNDEAIFRDAYVVEKIAENVQKYDRVMVVMGSSHVLREEAALREFFEDHGDA